MDNLNANSAKYWLPRISDVDLGPVQIPGTLMVDYDHPEMISMLEGGTDSLPFDLLVLKVRKVAEKIGYPVFIRTDLASAKHDGPKHFRADNHLDIERVLARTIEGNELKFWIGGPVPQAFLVREHLPLHATFTAFGGLPIAREWRWFASGFADRCCHFYWPAEAIERPSAPDWEEQLTALADRAEVPWGVLRNAAVRAARACDAWEYWSVDFAQDIDGGWWLIDMANGAESYHPEH